MFEITQVKIMLNHNKPVDEPVAFAVITICDVFIVQEIKLFRRNGDLDIVFQKRKAESGKLKDIAFPNNNETRDYIRQCVIDCYHQKLEQERNKPAALPGGRY